MGYSVIFLDIDGVLNNYHSKSRCGGFIGIDDDKVKRLREICDVTRAWIVLCSSWKSMWFRDTKEEQDALANYLDRKMKRQKLYVFDKTVDNGEDRGGGIRRWLANHEGIESWIVLDDEVFQDYDVYGIMPHLIKTSFYSENGGLQPEHVEKATRLLSRE